MKWGHNHHYGVFHSNISFMEQLLQQEKRGKRVCIYVSLVKENRTFKMFPPFGYTYLRWQFIAAKVSSGQGMLKPLVGWSKPKLLFSFTPKSLKWRLVRKRNLALLLLSYIQPQEILLVPKLLESSLQPKDLASCGHSCLKSLKKFFFFFFFLQMDQRQDLLFDSF